MISRPYLRTPRSKIVEAARNVSSKRHEFLSAVAKGLIPADCSPSLKKKSKIFSVEVDVRRCGQFYNNNQTVNDGVAHSKNPRKCAYHVTFDLDLDLEHTLDAILPGDHRVQIWSRSGHLPGRRIDFRATQKCPYHVTFDLDLDLEHTLDAG